MEAGKIINCISNRLRNRSQAIHIELGIGSAQGKLLNYVLVESAIHPVYQKDLEWEFGLRPSTITEGICISYFLWSSVCYLVSGSKLCCAFGRGK